MRRQTQKVSGRAAVAGYVGLVVLMSAGAATGLAGSNTVFTDDIVNGHVRYADIRDGAVAGRKILDNSITSADIGTNGVGSAEISDGSVQRQDVGFNAISGVTKVSQLHQVAGFETNTFTVVCPSDAPVVLGGGYEWSTPSGFSASTSEPWYVDGQPNGWFVQGTNSLAQPRNLYVIAICASDGSSG